MEILDPRRVVKLRNQSCPYCGESLDGLLSDEEHTIGRRFIPKGKLNGSWNLILRACRVCNHRKGQLEDDLSAVTMQPDAFGVYASDDPVLHQDSVRKSEGSVSRLTRKPIGQSQESFTIRGTLGPGVEVSFTFEAPPRFAPERALELARLQLSALFYWLTYDPVAARGGFWVGDAIALNVARKADWGNSIQRSFMSAVVPWEHRMLLVAADGYFKVAIRRHPDAECWSWALEWNRNVRLIGLFGDPTSIDEFCRRLEAPAASSLPQADGSTFRMRRETGLEEHDDVLFSPSWT